MPESFYRTARMGNAIGEQVQGVRPRKRGYETNIYTPETLPLAISDERTLVHVMDLPSGIGRYGINGTMSFIEIPYVDIPGILALREAGKRKMNLRSVRKYYAEYASDISTPFDQ